MNCDVCKTTLNSMQQYSQHIAGKAHAKKLAGAASGKPLASQKINFVPASGVGSHLHTVQPISSQSVSHVSRPMPPPPPPPLPPAATALNKAAPPQVEPGKKKKKKTSASAQAVSLSNDPEIYCDGVTVIKISPETDLWCEVCQIQLNSAEQARQHYTGTKHIKKARIHRLNQVGGFVQPSSGHGEHYCSFCSVFVNSHEQMEVHRAGAQHKKQVESRKRKQEEGMEGPTPKVKSGAEWGGGEGVAGQGDVTPVPSPDQNYTESSEFTSPFDVQSGF